MGAYGGRKDIMMRVAPDGDVYQAGTLSGNPLAMAAGIATLSLLKDPNVYQDLNEKGSRLFNGLRQAALKAGIPAVVNHLGSMGSLFFSDQAVTDFAKVKKANENQFRAYYKGMLESGIYLAPSAFECSFVSTAHSEADIEQTIECAGRIMASL